MKFHNIKSILPAVALTATMGLTSCMADLDHAPIDPTLDTAVDEQGLFNKCYASLIMEGNDGNADFTIQDNGKSTLLRNLFNFNELPTDEAICWWTDGGIEALSINAITPTNETLKYLYYRIMSNITFCNHYLDLYAGSGDKTQAAEVRFLRAYYYYLMMDFFGNVPFCDTSIDPSVPQSRPRAEMFDWILAELETAEKDMSPAQAKARSTDPGYGRADQAAVHFLRSRLYLNAEVYAGKKMYAEAAQEAKAVYTGTGYKLFTQADNKTSFKPYEMLFMGDNGENGAAVEAVLPLYQDGLTCQGWGGSLFFIAALWDPQMKTPYDTDPGTTGNNWSGMRMRKQFLEKFTSDPAMKIANATPYDWENKTAAEIRATTSDDRALFWGKESGDGSSNHTVDLFDNSRFDYGLATVKWNNNYAMGGTPHDNYNVDTDFFLFRVAEAKLNFAEATMRANGGTCTAEAKDAIDEIRQRAGAPVKDTYTLNDVLDERARELYCEGLRRPDLIRFGQFCGPNATYNWDLKGNVEHGAVIPAHLNVYPIPQVERDANPGLPQNAGYYNINP